MTKFDVFLSIIISLQVLSLLRGRSWRKRRVRQRLKWKLENTYIRVRKKIKGGNHAKHEA